MLREQNCFAFFRSTSLRYNLQKITSFFVSQTHDEVRADIPDPTQEGPTRNYFGSDFDLLTPIAMNRLLPDSSTANVDFRMPDLKRVMRCLPSFRT